MKGKFKGFKLLCFLFVSIFILGFGGEVKAETFSSREQLALRRGNGWSTYFQWIYNTSNNQDAYCLEHSKMGPLPGGIMSLNEAPANLTASQRRDIINILKESQRLSFKSAAERYYVTQAAVWYAKDGIGVSGGEGIVLGFYNWLVANYPEQWNALMNSRKNAIVEPTLSISGDDYNLEESDDYLISKDFKVSSTGVDGNFTVSINSGSSAGSCILYNDECETSIEVSGNTNFKIRVDKPSDASGTVDASFTVTPKTAPSVYDIKTYVGISGSNWQSTAMLVSTPRTLSETQRVKGKYVNNATVSIQKLDAGTGEKVAGAKLYVTDSNDNKLGEFVSTGVGEANPTISLSAGDYFLVESVQPGGYYHNSEKIAFTVTAGGQVTQGGNVVDSATISISNERVKLKFRKVDYQGNPMEGIKFIIIADGAAVAGESNSILCAVTDENGYLTRECTGSDKTNNVNANGIYTLGVDFGSTDGLYDVKEVCEVDSCKGYMRSSGESASFPGIGAFYIHGGQFISLFNNNLSLSSEGDATPVIVMTMTNNYYINITKSDITTGKEISGAKLVVSDPSITGDDNVIDEWTSGNESHEIQGIIPGHKYRLTETVPSAGYSYAINFVKMVNSIDFIMDENGNVTTYDITTGEKITDLVGTKYSLLITNDYTKTVFSKTSAVTGEEIEGAKLKVCTSDAYDAAKATTGDGNNCEAFVNPVNNEKVEWVSEAGKSKTVEALPAGKYYLVEELAPAGYVKQTNSAYFEVKSDGTITKVELKNEPTKVVISKKDVTTGEELPGAKIKICTLDSYEKDGSNCKPDKEEWSWTSGTEPNEIEAMPFGDYVLIETLPAPDYEEGMIINGDLMTAYKFTLSEENYNVKIDVYNQVITEVPKTGISTLNLFAIGGLMVFVGYETIKIYRRKALNN